MATLRHPRPMDEWMNLGCRFILNILGDSAHYSRGTERTEDLDRFVRLALSCASSGDEIVTLLGKFQSKRCLNYVISKAAPAIAGTPMDRLDGGRAVGEALLAMVSNHDEFCREALAVLPVPTT